MRYRASPGAVDELVGVDLTGLLLVVPVCVAVVGLCRPLLRRGGGSLDTGPVARARVARVRLGS